MSKSVAIVTGASQGIGRATAIRLARDFSALVLVARNRANLEDTARSVKDARADVRVIDADLAEPAVAQTVVDQALAAFGRIDCAFNNAGISGGALPDEFWDTALFERTFAINARGVFFCLKHEIAQMLKQGTWYCPTN